MEILTFQFQTSDCFTMEVEDDCIIIEDSDEDAGEEKNTKEVFVISDSEETNDVSPLKSWKPFYQENANLENPMYCEDDLTKSEESEELEKDVLLQRLKKKLLQAKSLKEQQSLENLIEKRVQVIDHLVQNEGKVGVLSHRQTFLDNHFKT